MFKEFSLMKRMWENLVTFALKTVILSNLGSLAAKNSTSLIALFGSLFS